MADTLQRSASKTATYRFTGSSITSALAFLATGNIGSALSIGAKDVFWKSILYFSNERIWNNIKFGRYVDEERPNETRDTFSRVLVKGLIYRLVGSVASGAITYGTTGDSNVSFNVGTSDFVIKFGIFIGHELGWDKLSFGKFIGQDKRYEESELIKVMVEND